MMARKYGFQKSENAEDDERNVEAKSPPKKRDIKSNNRNKIS